MSYYLIGMTNTANPAAMKDYVERVRPMVENHGGQFVLEAAIEQVMEGAFPATNGVVMRFDSAEAAQRWYSSPEYIELKKVRTDNGESILVLARPYNSDE
ncbi:DUF1330 domain-containing protein [Stackebrandtia nassauensis]|uniref:DUF1330 domain-containing protein n=1 Tax=Stackebrandtia nassauensis (strain DSM 44728 / CIP 108903 / NRRL B-16338 / NBRC 102104 / LLR-40K-21) TaxID=446470 RepID=D3Q3F6_STANL|nr:DUF1330 domain-containing protein [Stackebrandtia nassauensis]ADD41997.1 protein of unknown function DUF1330 [Stackebrandtia nassauensis DSM 44728]